MPGDDLEWLEQMRRDRKQYEADRPAREAAEATRADAAARLAATVRGLVEQYGKAWAANAVYDAMDAADIDYCRYTE